MKNTKEIINRFTIIWCQPIADYLIERLENSLEEKEFETWFKLSLYLDLYCINKGVYLN